jgi:ribosomal protein L37AE/L43A
MTIEQAKLPDGELDEVVEVATTVDPHRRLDQLAPLIHELIAWELVYRDNSGKFVLHEDVQRRLSEVTALRPQSIAQVYVGRQCEHCGVVGVTRLIDGLRTCASCSRAVKESDAEPVFEKPVVRHRSRWHRKAG